MPGLRQTDAVAGDDHGRTALQRCIRNEQQSDQRQTDHCKKGESWHCCAPDCATSALRRMNLNQAIDWSSWTMGQLQVANRKTGGTFAAKDRQGPPVARAPAQCRRKRAAPPALNEISHSGEYG